MNFHSWTNLNNKFLKLETRLDTNVHKDRHIFYKGLGSILTYAVFRLQTIKMIKIFAVGCPPGTYPDDSEGCAKCPLNSVSLGGATGCTSCQLGHTPNSAQSYCGNYLLSAFTDLEISQSWVGYCDAFLG